MSERPIHISGIPSKEDLLLLLHEGAARYRCGDYLSHLDTLQRLSIYNRLESERLNHKCTKIKMLYESSKQDWNQVMFIIFMRALSDEQNRDNFMEIAHRIDFNVLLRERGSLESLEAILIGTSGLLRTFKSNDDFIRSQSSKADYKLKLYGITPMSPRVWSTKGLYASKMPIIRLTQVARLIYDNDLLFSKMMSCNSRDDLFAIFNVESSEDWCRYLRCRTRYQLGRIKIDLIGINLIVPMQYSYGFYTADDSIVLTAGELNESLPPESNRYIRGWQNRGVSPVSAFETQALIELTREYCMQKRCEECHLFHQMTSSGSILASLPSFLDHQR